MHTELGIALRNELSIGVVSKESMLSNFMPGSVRATFAGAKFSARDPVRGERAQDIVVAGEFAEWGCTQAAGTQGTT